MTARIATACLVLAWLLRWAAAQPTPPEAPPSPEVEPEVVPSPVPPAAEEPEVTPLEPEVTPLGDVVPLPAEPAKAKGFVVQRNFVGSIQLDYLAVPTMARARESAFDGATVELSLKLAVDLGEHVSAHVKACIACHGPEVGMAYFEIRGRDELNLKVGRFSPAMGSFPLRHDPANHRTSDKPLPYDMGRMLGLREWNEGILPAPWVDNGVEVYGTHFFGGNQIDYAAYAISGPKGTAEGADFDFTLSRSGERYYVDNNSQPTVGGRVGATFGLGPQSSLSLGSSTMAGRYDPDASLDFLIVGVDAVLQLGQTFLRAEYLARWTEVELGADPGARFKYGPGASGTYDDLVLKDGFYVEAETPVGRVDLVARWDGLRRFGNVLVGSPLRSKSIVLRYTAGVAVRVGSGLRVKASVEGYDFSDLDDQLATHLSLVGAF